MFDAIAARYDRVNRVITFGLDRGWRKRTVASLALPPSSIVLDLGCGTGDLVRELAGRDLEPIGLDLSLAMLNAAPQRTGRLVQADAGLLPIGDRAVDGIVSGFALRNFVDPATVFAEMARVLRPGGRLGLLEVDTPSNPLLRLGDKVWFTHVVPRIGALLSDASAYRYLPRSVVYLPARHELADMLAIAGFRDIVHRRCTGGVAQIVTATRASQPAAERLASGTTT